MQNHVCENTTYHCPFEKKREIQFYGVNFFLIFEKTGDFHGIKKDNVVGFSKI